MKNEKHLIMMLENGDVSEEQQFADQKAKDEKLLTSSVSNFWRIHNAV